MKLAPRIAGQVTGRIGRVKFQSVNNEQNTNDMSNTNTPKVRIHKKGTSESPRLVLDASQKYKVYQWVEKNKSLCEKRAAEELAELASKEIGFSISSTSILTFRNAVYPELKKVRVYGKPDQVSELKSRVERLEQKIEEMDRYSNYLCEEISKLEKIMK